MNLKLNYFLLFFFFISLISCQKNNNQIFLTQESHFLMNENEKKINIDTALHNKFINLNLDTTINKPLYKVIDNLKNGYRIYISYCVNVKFNDLQQKYNNEQNNLIETTTNKNYILRKYKIESEYIYDYSLKLHNDIVNIMCISNDLKTLDAKFKYSSLTKRIKS